MTSHTSQFSDRFRYPWTGRKPSERVSSMMTHHVTYKKGPYTTKETRDALMVDVTKTETWGVELAAELKTHEDRFAALERDILALKAKDTAHDARFGAQETRLAKLELDNKMLAFRLLGDVVEDRILQALGGYWTDRSMRSAYTAYARARGTLTTRNGVIMTPEDVVTFEATLQRAFPNCDPLKQANVLRRSIQFTKRTGFRPAHDATTTEDEVLKAIDKLATSATYKQDYRDMLEAAKRLQPPGFTLMQLTSREDWEAGEA